MGYQITEEDEKHYFQRIDYSYLGPDTSVLKRYPKDEEIFEFFASGNFQRKIFYNVGWNKYEQEAVKDFHDAISLTIQYEHKAPKWWSEEESLRFLHISGFDPVKAKEVLEKTLGWPR